ncbi:hypothetical protein ACP70R_019738 [Stipagrostis hirtigluma subsp. patula]
MRSSPPPWHTRDVPRLRRREAAPKRRKTSSRSRGPPSSQDTLINPPAPALPPELVLEIVDRCDDPATLIASAAACRLLRRHVLGADFIRRQRDAARGRFAPSSLLGLFYRHYDGEPAPRPPPFTATSDAVRTPFAPAAVFAGYTPAESRGGLLVLRRSALFAERAGLCVYDPVTRRRAFLPPPEVHQQSYALLLAGDDHADAGALFRRLVVVDLSGLLFHRTVRAQSFSPEEAGGGAWGPVVDAFVPGHLMRCEVARPSPVILDGDGALLHWLCTDHRTVLTLDADTAEAGTLQLPPYHVLYPRFFLPEHQLLASSAEGELSLLVAERLVITVWVRRAATEQWERRAAVDVERMLLLAKVEPALPIWWNSRMQIEWFGEKSGAVVAQVAGVGLLVLNVETEEVCMVQRSNDLVPFRYCPYERDLLGLLAAMARR